MKWIKLFEGFNNSDFYQEIDRSEGLNLIKNNCKNMDDNTIYNIFNLDFNNLRFKFKEIGNPKSNNYTKREIKPGYRYIEFTFPNLNVEIVELYDEWFVLRFFTTISGKMDIISKPITYKCDQWEGLIELLKDKDLIK